MKCTLNRPSCWITPQELKWWHSVRYSCAFPCKHTNFFVSQLRLWAGWASEGKLGFTPGLPTHGGVTCPPNIQPEVEVALSTSEQTKLLRSDCSSHTGRCVYMGKLKRSQTCELARTLSTGDEAKKAMKPNRPSEICSYILRWNKMFNR